MTREDSDRRPLTRVALALAVTALVVAAPVLAASPAASIDATERDKVTAAAEGDLPDDVLRYGSESHPGWQIKLSNTDAAYDALKDWAEASDQREIVADNFAGNWTVVSAPASHIRGGISFSLNSLGLMDGLDSRSYVEVVDVERSVSLPEPVTLESNQTHQTPPGSSFLALMRPGVSSDDFSKIGMAFSEDAPETTIGEARNITGADTVASTGAGTMAAVIDSGCNTQDGQVFGNGTAGSDIRIDNASKSFLDGDSVDASAGNFDAVEDQNGHGTHVAATVLANTTNASYDGMAPDATLLCLKALNGEGSGSTHDISRAIRYAADQNADVVSMSLGSPVYSQALADAIRYATEKGSLVVVAAGNSRQTVRWIASPADTPGDSVLTVGAANGTENASRIPHALPAYFSQIGPDPSSLDASAGVTAGQTVDLVSVGMRLTAPTPTTSATRSNTTLSGTSMATPTVAGAALLAIDANGWTDSPATTAGYVANTSTPLPHAAETAVGSGYLDVEALIERNTTGEQAAEMTPEAEGRTVAYRTYSTASGQWSFRLIQEMSSRADEATN